MEEIGYRILKLDDANVTKEFILEHYITREPIGNHLKITPEEFWRYFEPEVKTCLSHDVSIGAFDQTSGTMCAAMLNMLGNRKSLQSPLFESQTLNIRQLLKLHQVAFGGGLSACMGTDNYLRIGITSVKEEYGKMGVATQLALRTYQIAKHLSCSYTTIECSSEYSRRLTTKLGYEVKKEIFYTDYVDPLTSRKIFEGMVQPHTTFTWMTKRVE